MRYHIAILFITLFGPSFVNYECFIYNIKLYIYIILLYNNRTLYNRQSHNVFKDIFIGSSNMTKSLGFDIQLPRISNTRKMNGAWLATQNVEDIIIAGRIYIPLLDGVLRDINTRFCPDVIGAIFSHCRFTY